MQVPTEITFHGLEHSDAVEASIDRWIDRIERFYDRIIKCNVTVGQPHRRRRHGGEYNVSIVLEIPGGEIATTHAGNEDIYVAIADAFRAARRQLLDHVDVQRGFVKTNVVAREGHVGANVDKQRMNM